MNALTDLIAGLRRDAGDYAKDVQGVPMSHELVWDARNVRAWDAAEALERQAAQEPTDEQVEAAAEAILDASFGQELPEAPIDLARAALRAAYATGGAA